MLYLGQWFIYPNIKRNFNWIWSNISSSETISNIGSCSNSVYDIVSGSTDHTTLKTAIDTCSLNSTLSGPGPFTLFAPTDVLLIYCLQEQSQLF